MCAQTDKINKGGLGCANRVRKGLLGGVRCARLRATDFFLFLLLLPLVSRRLINGCSVIILHCFVYKLS